MRKSEEREGNDHGNPRFHSDTRDTDHEFSHGKNGCIPAISANAMCMSVDMIQVRPDSLEVTQCWEVARAHERRKSMVPQTENVLAFWWIMDT